MTKENAIKNLDEVITKVEFSRLQVDNHKIVQLVAISKYSTAEDIEKLYESGQRAFGENKVQDLKIKQEALEELPIAWHFVGSLQKNKINNLIDLNPILMHSLDSLELAEDLDKKLKAKNKKMNCLLQVNSACEETKSGFSKDEAINMYHQIQEKYTNINLKGIMSIGAHSEDREIITESFKTTKNIFDKCKDATICSMGMSGDFEMAILEGSSMIRVGSSLFK